MRHLVKLLPIPLIVPLNNAFTDLQMLIHGH